MKPFWKLGIGTVAAVVAGIGVAVMLPASETQAAAAPPTTYRTAYATKFDPDTFTFMAVEMWQGPDFFTGELVTTLNVNAFGLGFAFGSVVLQPGQFTFGTFGASVDGPITVELVKYGSFCDPPTFGTVEVGDLTWSTPPGPITPSVFCQNGPAFHVVSRSLSRQGTATGTISGDIEFNLATADSVANGVILERAQY